VKNSLSGGLEKPERTGYNYSKKYGKNSLIINGQIEAFRP